MKEDLKKMAAFLTAKKLTPGQMEIEGLKKKLWGMKEDPKKMSTFLRAKQLAPGQMERT
jgi:hypothetical protein